MKYRPYITLEIPKSLSKPRVELRQECENRFGPNGWYLIFDVTYNRNMINIYPDQLDDYGKEGLCIAKLSWDQVK
jgi:hypothetical protein